jgi:hypothetical protein
MNLWLESLLLAPLESNYLSPHRMKPLFSSTRQAKRPFVKPCEKMSGKIAIMAIFHLPTLIIALDQACRLLTSLPWSKRKGKPKVKSLIRTATGEVI